jgi:hypothetical protein
MLTSKNGAIRQTPESNELREFFRVKLGDELPIYVNMVHVDGVLLVIPETPSMERH